jgi:hypothetical protein
MAREPNLPPVEGERFVIRWANGHYVIFDRERFVVARTAGTLKDIERIFQTGK